MATRCSSAGCFAQHEVITRQEMDAACSNPAAWPKGMPLPKLSTGEADDPLTPLNGKKSGRQVIPWSIFCCSSSFPNPLQSLALVCQSKHEYPLACALATMTVKGASPRIAVIARRQPLLSGNPFSRLDSARAMKVVLHYLSILEIEA